MYLPMQFADRLRLQALKQLHMCIVQDRFLFALKIRCKFVCVCVCVYVCVCACVCVCLRAGVFFKWLM